jgi:hypothetical protein
VAAFAASCSAEEDVGSRAPAKFDACTLLTDDQVATALGLSSVETQADQRGEDLFWMSRCRYEADAADGLVTASLMIRPHQGQASAEQAYTEFDSELVSQFGETSRLEPVAGVGESAGWQDFGTAIGQLILFDGPYQLIIAAPATAGHSQLENSRTLAELALQQLSAR